MLSHVATLVGQDQFCFFPLLLFNMAIVFLGIAAMLRDQFLAIAGIECSTFFIFFYLKSLERIKCFYIIFNGKNCFLIRIFPIRTA